MIFKKNFNAPFLAFFLIILTLIGKVQAQVDISLSSETLLSSNIELINRLAHYPNSLSLQNGDTNADGKIDISDGIFLLNHILRSGPPPAPTARRHISFDFKAPIYKLQKSQIYAEYNLDEQEIEITLEIEHPSTLSKIQLLNPWGESILFVDTSLDSSLGLGKIQFELLSANPYQLGLLPPGEYVLKGFTNQGEQVAKFLDVDYDFYTHLELHHSHNASELKLVWETSTFATQYHIEIESEDESFHLKKILNSETETYRLPTHLFDENTEIEISLSLITQAGNIITTDQTVFISNIEAPCE